MLDIVTWFGFEVKLNIQKNIGQKFASELCEKQMLASEACAFSLRKKKF